MKYLAIYNHSPLEALGSFNLVRAYFAPYGVGLGHASRLMMVAERLKSTGFRVIFSTFGEALKYLDMHGYDCFKVPEVEFSWSIEGEFSVKYSIANIPKWFFNFSKQLGYEGRNIANYDPDIILSDSRLSPIFAAKFLKIPSLVILNQIKLLFSPRLRKFRAARLFEKLTGECLGVMWTTADKVLVPDLPPPYTIAEKNIWDVSSVTSKLVYVGFTTPKKRLSNEQINNVAHRLSFDKTKPLIFMHISGPRQTRLPIINIAIQACRNLKSEIQFVISEGNPKGDHEPRRIAESGWYFEWCPVRDEIFAMSDALVLRGGHVALSQAIQFGKPIVTIPIENHGEQIGNSQKIAKLGVGIMLHQKGLTVEQLTEGIRKILFSTIYTKRAMELMTLTEKLSGIDNIVQIVRSYF